MLTLPDEKTLEKWEQMLARRWGLSTQRIQLAKAMTFRFGNDETLETRTLAFLPVGIAGVNGVLRVYVVPGFERRSCCRKNFLETSVATLIWVAGTCSLRSWEFEQW